MSIVRLTVEEDVFEDCTDCLEVALAVSDLGVLDQPAETRRQDEFDLDGQIRIGRGQVRQEIENGREESVQSVMEVGLVTGREVLRADQLQVSLARLLEAIEMVESRVLRRESPFRTNRVNDGVEVRAVVGEGDGRERRRRQRRLTVRQQTGRMLESVASERERTIQF